MDERQANVRGNLPGLGSPSSELTPLETLNRSSNVAKLMRKALLPADALAEQPNCVKKLRPVFVSDIVSHFARDAKAGHESKSFQRGVGAVFSVAAARVKLPEDIAKVIDLNTFILRFSWSRGRHPSLVKSSERANKLIRTISLRSNSKRREDILLFPGMEVMELIDYLKTAFQVWLEERARPEAQQNQERRHTSAKLVAVSMLSIISFTSRVGINWKSFIDPRWTNALQSSLLVEVDLPGAIVRSLQTYFADDQLRPTHSQEALLKIAAPYIKLIHDNVASKDLEEAELNLIVLSRLLDQFTALNTGLQLKRRDHALPLEFACVVILWARGDYSSKKRQEQISASAYVLFQLGHKAIAKTLIADEALSKMPNLRIPLRNYCRNKVRRTKLEYLRPIDTTLDEDAEKRIEQEMEVLEKRMLDMGESDSRSAPWNLSLDSGAEVEEVLKVAYQERSPHFRAVGRSIETKFAKTKESATNDEDDADGKKSASTDTERPTPS